MGKRTAATPVRRPSRHRPSAKPAATRGEEWQRGRASFEAAHVAFASGAEIERIVLAAIVKKLGLDLKTLSALAAESRRAQALLIAEGLRQAQARFDAQSTAGS